MLLSFPNHPEDPGYVIDIGKLKLTNLQKKKPQWYFNRKYIL